jgi:Tfp pilus assembly protein PilF
VLPAVGLLCVGVAVAAWYWLAPAAQPPTGEAKQDHDSPPPDPRLTFPTEFRNVRPEVKYVGDAACAHCHKPIARTFREHPMGRSAEWVNRGPTAVDHAAGANNPCTASVYGLRVERKGEQVWHHATAASADGDAPPYSVLAELAIGSGTHGRSYLTVDRGAVWQSPVSWFAQGKRWDISPGFDTVNEIRRPVIPECLRCHTDRPESIPHSLNRYREPLLHAQTSIGCERCHGPGELHVAERADGSARVAPDHSITNPKHLPAELKADVCRQCHLQGAAQITRRGRDALEYRPGLPWEQFVSTFVRHPDLTDYRKSVGQFEQMEASRCFAESGGKLGCVSCHDPHAKPAPAETAAYFRDKCNACHETRPCSLPVPRRQEKGDSCVACHMPARDSSNVAHVAVTDHRIMKRPDAGGARAKSLAPGEMPLVAYRPGAHAPAVEERDRDLAIALGNEFARGSTSPDRWQRAEAKLDQALRRWPDDGAAWITRSRTHAKNDRGDLAVEAARRAADVHPDSEVALIQLAGAAVAADDYELAVRTADKLILLNPSSADHLLTRASAFFFLKDWQKAEADCRAALAIQPLQPKARFMLAVCRNKRGDPVAGLKELNLALALTPTPQMRSSLSEGYSELTR